MDFRILGPLELGVRDRTVRLRGARQRALLGVLLVNANRVLSTDRLIEDVWGDRPPASGAAALQMRLSQLRRALAPLAGPPEAEAPTAILATEPSGYVLRVAADGVDAHRFERLLAEGRALSADGDAVAAAVCLAGALSLWRGPALADFAFEPFAQAEIARLEELRLAAKEERLEADLALGRHDALVAELEAAVVEHPLRERLRGQLMVALYRSGRQADALGAYRDARRHFADELGVEPGPTLKRLEEQVLRHAPELEVPGHATASSGGRPDATAVAVTRKPLTVACTALGVATLRAGTLDPERRGRALARGLSAVAQTFQQYGAHVQRLPGAVLAAFGLPVVREDDAFRAAQATMAAHEQLRALAEELERDHDLQVQARSGIATGDVLARAAALDEVLATGEPADTALDLSALADPDEVLLADSTQPLVRHAVALTRRATSHGSSAWSVTAVAEEHGGHAVRRDAPLVGRLAELTALARTLERAVRAQQVQTCTVVGPAGVGKSRVVQEFAESVGQAAAVVTGACTPYGEIATFWPLRQVVEQVAAGRPLGEVVGAAEHADLVARLVAAAVGVGEAQGGGDVFWAVGRFLEAASQVRPLVVVLEDFHWAAPTMVALVEFLAAWPRPAAIVLVCLARPELVDEHPGWRDLPRSTSIALPPLDPLESDTLLRHLAGPHTLTTDARDRVSRAAEGNPLFLEQLLVMLTEHPGLDLETDLPPTIAALLAARLDRLGPGERAVVERAAVVGRAFHRDAVAALLPAPARSTVDRHLAALVARDLLAAQARHDIAATHMFRHGLIHTAAYRGTPTGTRADLHESLATWLDSSRDATDEVVGHHLERAFQGRAALGSRDERTLRLAGLAARRLRLAGERAHDRGDMPAAAALLDRARGLPAGDDAVALEILPGLGYALFEVGELQRAEEILRGAVERADAAGNLRIRWQAAVTLMHLRMYLHPEGIDPGDLAGQAAVAMRVLEAWEDDVGLARALMLWSDLEFMSGRAASTQEAMERGLGVARRAGSRREEAWCGGQLGFALIAGPAPATEGRDRCQQILDEAAADPVARANLLPFLAVHEAMLGDFGLARAHAAEGRSATRELGLRWQDGIHSLLSSYVELYAGDPFAAEELVRAASTSFAEIGDSWFLCMAAVDLPRSLYEQGHYDLARAAVADAAAHHVSDVEWRIKRRGVPALLLARDGRFAEAEELAREGVAVAAASDFLVWRADAQVDLAEVLERAGRRDEARPVLAEALRLYARKGHIVGENRARARLGSLGPPNPRAPVSRSTRHGASSA